MVRLTATALLASFLTSVSAGSVQHQLHGHLHRKSYAPAPPQYDTPSAPAPTHDAPAAPKYDVPAEMKPEANATSCGCTTYTSTWYGEPTLLSPPKPSTTSIEVKPSTTSVEVKPTAPAYTPPKKEDKPKPAPKPEAPKKPSGYGGIAPNGNKWAMTYTPYRPDGQCKTASEVSDDIGSIKSKGFSTVRIYATDCNGPQNVGDACKAHGMKMILGIFIDAKGLGAAHEQVNDLTAWGKNGNCWSMVEMVVAGNEAIFGGFTTAPEMANFITEAKSAFKAAGYNGPVTTTETLDVIQKNADVLCPVVDVIGANLHPFFNGQHAAADAGDLVAQQLKDLSAACGGKLEAYNLETGWPSHGKANGVAIPGKDEQRQAIDSIVAKVGSKSAIFSFEDDTWKAPGEYDIEQYWGCASLFD
ncbi:Putative glycoside hydrolase superfamily [Septoria linicola]|uniref:Probable beta-glucosidase btgE n=1 Tax=Septoria linicola TaxID=215465 RepID=A0A9Q9EKK4_9PEZI|nr:putative glycoside hydrolase superfamily [Septoria linicola]USW54901.1 Putative glycoside hydrolase superfamily [Septoria linicola]